MHFLAHSKNALMQWRGVRRLSVRLSVNFCANRFSHTNGRIATKLAHDGLQVSVHPGCAQGQGQRSRDTRTFWILGMSYSVSDGLVGFYRAMHLSAYARSWDRMSSVCLSVRLSVTLVDCDHIR